MATSAVGICNIALIRVGVKETISSLDVPTTVPERLCAVLFQDCLDAVLKEFNWSCARSRASLTADSTTPKGWDYRYLLPASPYCLRVISVQCKDAVDSDPGIPYSIEGRYILCNEEDGIDIRYVKRISIYTDMDADLTQAVALRIAQGLLPSFTWTASRKQDITNEYKDTTIRAKINGAAQDYIDESQESDTFRGDSDWISAGR